MFRADDYVKAESLAEAYELCKNEAAWCWAEWSG